MAVSLWLLCSITYVLVTVVSLYPMLMVFLVFYWQQISLLTDVMLSVTVTRVMFRCHWLSESVACSSFAVYAPVWHHWTVICQPLTSWTCILIWLVSCSSSTEHCAVTGCSLVVNNHVQLLLSLVMMSLWPRWRLLLSSLCLMSTSSTLVYNNFFMMWSDLTSTHKITLSAVIHV